MSFRSPKNPGKIYQKKLCFSFLNILPTNPNTQTKVSSSVQPQIQRALKSCKMTLPLLGMVVQGDFLLAKTIFLAQSISLQMNLDALIYLYQLGAQYLKICCLRDFICKMKVFLQSADAFVLNVLKITSPAYKQLHKHSKTR